jgi:hypothetical protein
MRLPAHHSPHWLLVQLVPVMGQRMAYRRSELTPLARLLVSLRASRLVSPSVQEGVAEVEAAEQAQEPLG